MSDKLYTPVNKNAHEEVKKVLKYLSDITYEKIVTGQHVQTLAMEELETIKKHTGKEPALLGFELLSYSPNINYLDTDEECMTEVAENYGMLKRAWEWAQKKGLITFTWHWFSPTGGRSKSFFSANTDFDARRAVTEGTEEYKALISDLDVMAGLLRPFCDKHIPILWRPFHESEGDWFWWGKHGPETVRELWRIMYERYTYHHRLDNLIWVWNSTKKECYPGDEMVDIISRDMYPEAHKHGSQKAEYDGMLGMTDTKKIVTIGEIGVLPDPEAVYDEKAGWASFMVWSKVFCLSEEFNSFEYLKKIYESERAVTLDSLPELY